ncbi:MAG TPA: DUF4037 domain-containing protein [Anaerolineae bacterium]|nr:DUF4037 domain-containing protein [Anaerolineae bacterium]
MSDSIIEISRAFFEQVVKPILLAHFPDETARTAFGIFGYGSEALGLDDVYSRDHHWGLRIDALMPDDVFAEKREAIMQTLAAHLPETFQGHSLREGHLAGAGMAPDTLTAMLWRTIGMDRPPRTYEEWLSVPEDDVIHIVNGEVWYDPLGRFTEVREAFQAYYPEPVRLRRIAHWSRYFSGMGTYALRRAILRDNAYYCNITFSRALRWGVQLAFLLEKVYCPYDKWTLAYLDRLPRLGGEIRPIITESTQLSTGWERKLDLLHELTDILDRTMVADGIIKPHPKFAVSPTSGYRLMEYAYAEIIQGLPDEIKTCVPVWDQIYMEEFHSGYVDTIDLGDWARVLQLKEE